MDTNAILARVEEVEKRANAATPGPWADEKPPNSPDGWTTGVIIAAVMRGMGIYADPPGGSFPSADRKFIAHARTDIPTLAADIRSLVAEVTMLREALRGAAVVVETARQIKRSAVQRATAAETLLAGLLAELDRIYPPTGAFWSGAPKQEAARAHLSAHTPEDAA